VADPVGVVVGRRPGFRGNLPDHWLHVLGDRHADGGTRGRPARVGHRVGLNAFFQVGAACSLSECAITLVASKFTVTSPQSVPGAASPALHPGSLVDVRKELLKEQSRNACLDDRSGGNVPAVGVDGLLALSVTVRRLRAGVSGPGEEGAECVQGLPCPRKPGSAGFGPSVERTPGVPDARAP
jgi:hypothetical protein